ncbi:C-type lectin mannose-binding isoform-like [Babylonia areolata]|uniref:C-type lectin mannose-binding isoform-like n=1 Tax=Babylonia areolata TaxID=304850 RepID=UPI003FD5E48C
MMFRLYIFLSVVASVCLAVSVNDCPANLPRNQYLRAFGDRCYQFVLHHTREFDAAENECRARGGHLVVIRDIATQHFLYSTLLHEFDYYGVVWIGLSDQLSESHYTWTDGTPAHFTFWARGQPGIVDSSENCVALDILEGGKWTNYECSDSFFNGHHERFICEFPLVPHTTKQPTTQPPTTTVPPTAQPPTTTQTPTTRPQPTTTAPTMGPISTPAPSTTATTPTLTTPQPTTPTTTSEQSTAAATTTTASFQGGCSPFNCNVDCGLSGYKVDDNNCLVCQCEE